MTASSSALIAAAIDFGTTFSSWAFAFKHNFKNDPAKIESKHWTGGGTISLKGPTAVLIQPDGRTFDSFGYDAEDKYSALFASGEHQDWFYFQRFKMQLINSEGLVRDLMLEDASGKRLNASTVFGLSIRFMKDDLISTCQSRVLKEGTKETNVCKTVVKEDIHWVLTVPAIWTDAAKQFMREAAVWAGISNSNLTIALEPECASILCRYVPLVMGSDDFLKSFSAGFSYIVVDAGGGTVDMIVHEVTEIGALRELCQASGGAWGGTRVDAAFEAFLNKLFGRMIMDIFETTEIEDFTELLRSFEIKKRDVNNDAGQPMTIALPPSLLKLYKKTTGRDIREDLPLSTTASGLKLQGNKLRIDKKIMRDFFNESIDKTISNVSSILEKPEATRVKTLVLVGGLSESTIYRDAIKHKFPKLKVVVPQDASLAVLKGAVIYGHDPSTVIERVVKYTYGFSGSHKFAYTCSHSEGRQEIDENGDLRCYDLFIECVKMGARVKVGTQLNGPTVSPITDGQDDVTTDIFATTQETPKFVTEPGCVRIGTISAPITDKRKNVQFTISMTFGGTEIEVYLKEESTGAIVKATANFLG